MLYVTVHDLKYTVCTCAATKFLGYRSGSGPWYGTYYEIRHNRNVMTICSLRDNAIFGALLAADILHLLRTENPNRRNFVLKFFKIPQFLLNMLFTIDSDTVGLKIKYLSLFVQRKHSKNIGTDQIDICTVARRFYIYILSIWCCR